MHMHILKFLGCRDLNPFLFPLSQKIRKNKIDFLGSTNATYCSRVVKLRIYVKRLICSIYLSIHSRYCSLCFLPRGKRDEPISRRSSFRTIKDDPGWNWFESLSKEVSEMGWSRLPLKIRHIKLMSSLSRLGTRRTWWRRFLEPLGKLYFDNPAQHFLHYVSRISSWRKTDVVIFQSYWFFSFW